MMYDIYDTVSELDYTEIEVDFVQTKVMSIKPAFWKVVISLPESLKRKLLHYAEYLLEKYPNNQQSTEIMKPAQGYGSWAGQIIISDDFDEPLEDFEEYM